MTKIRNAYAPGVPGLPVMPPAIVAERAPVSSDIGFDIGQVWIYNDTFYVLVNVAAGIATWLVADVSGAVNTLTGDTGGPISPVVGNIDILGDSVDGASVVGTTGTLTINIAAATTTQRGTLETSTDAESVTGTSTAVAVTPASLTARLAAPGPIGGTTPGAGHFTTVDSTSTIIAGTSLTATLGAITATNGNLVLGTAGNKILSTSVGTTTTAGANSFGSVTLVGGTATVSTTAVTSSSLIIIWRQTVGATGAAALGHLCHGTITNGTSFVINSNLTADATALATTDVSVVGYMIIN